MIGLLCNVCGDEDAVRFADTGLSLCTHCRAVEEALCPHGLLHRLPPKPGDHFAIEEAFELRAEDVRRKARIAVWQKTSPRPTAAQLRENP
jgi:hypothetical protein